MSILNVSSFIQLIVKGLVLLFALAFDAYMIRHRTWSFAGVPAAPAATPAGKD
jgi:hypothetical protein